MDNDTNAGAAAAAAPERPKVNARIGDAVQYLPTGPDAKWRAATVVDVDEDTGQVALHVLRPEFNTVEWRDDVKEGKDAGNWRHLPPRPKRDDNAKVK